MGTHCLCLSLLALRWDLSFRCFFFFSLSLSLALSLSLSLSLSVMHLALCLPICRTVFPSLCLYVCLAIHLSIRLSVLPICLFVDLSVCLSVCLSIYHLSICMDGSLHISLLGSRSLTHDTCRNLQRKVSQHTDEAFVLQLTRDTKPDCRGLRATYHQLGAYEGHMYGALIIRIGTWAR